MIEITDWQNVNWTDGEVYRALVGYDGNLPIEANDVTLYMGDYIFDGNGDRAITAYNYQDIKIHDGIYKNAELGIYAKRQLGTNLPDGGLHLGLEIHGKPEFYNCGNGVKLFGSDCKVTGYMDGIDADGIWIYGHNCEVSYCRIKNVDLSNQGGDCVQFAGSDNPYIHNNMLDHSNKATKQSLIVAQRELNSPIHAQGGIVEHNILVGGKCVFHSKNDRLTIKNNTIVAVNGSEHVINVGQTDNNLSIDNKLVTSGLAPYTVWKATNFIHSDIVL